MFIFDRFLTNSEFIKWSVICFFSILFTNSCQLRSPQDSDITSNPSDDSIRSIASSDSDSPLFIAETATLHVILVADLELELKKLGGKPIGSEADLSNMKRRVVDVIVRQTKLPLNLQIIDEQIKLGGGGYEQVKRTVEQLPVLSGKDVVIFYYSGHGIDTGTTSDKWPRLALGGIKSSQSERLELSWIKNTLWDKKPRLLIVMADACNRGTAKDKAMPTVIPFPIPKSVKTLFLNYQGYILASSSVPGQFSYGYPSGGLFTNIFLKNLEQEMASPTPSWSKIIENSEQPIKTGIPAQSKQNPQFESTVVLVNSLQ